MSNLVKTKQSYVIVFSMLFLLLAGCAVQPIAEADKTIERVMEAPTYSKEQIFNSTKIWIAENFKSAKSVIEYENKEDGTVIGNGVIDFPCSGMSCIGQEHWTVPFTMRVDMKNERLKLTFINVQIKYPASAYVSAYEGAVFNKLDLDKIKPELLKLGDKLLSSMDKNKKASNW